VRAEGTNARAGHQSQQLAATVEDDKLKESARNAPDTGSHASRLTVLAAALLCCLNAGRAGAVAPDYSLWDEVLLTHVRRGYVDYSRLRDDSRLDKFLAQLATTDPDSVAGEEQRKAFLINAYNAYAIRGILDGESTGSQSKRRRFFNRYGFELMGEPSTLQDIEHQRLRPMGDPRIHFAIVCASLSCPRLSSRAFVPERLDAQLDEAARSFINDPTRNRFELERGQAWVSPIFDWFDEDFAATDGSVPAFLARYVRAPDVAKRLADGELRLRFDRYDWGLNGRLGPAP